MTEILKKTDIFSMRLYLAGTLDIQKTKTKKSGSTMTRTGSLIDNHTNFREQMRPRDSNRKRVEQGRAELSRRPEHCSLEKSRTEQAEQSSLEQMSRGIYI